MIARHTAIIEEQKKEIEMRHQLIWKTLFKQPLWELKMQLRFAEEESCKCSTCLVRIEEYQKCENCENCVKKCCHCFECDDCGHTYFGEELVLYGEREFCKECVAECAGCDQTFPKSEFPDTISELYYCDDCLSDGRICNVCAKFHYESDFCEGCVNCFDCYSKCNHCNLCHHCCTCCPCKRQCEKCERCEDWKCECDCKN